MKNQAFARSLLNFAPLLLLLLASCAPQNEGGGVDMSIMMKAKEDMEQVKAGFQEMKGELSRLGTRLDQIEAAIKSAKAPAAAESPQIAALLQELQGIKQALGEQSEQLNKLARPAVAESEPAGEAPQEPKPAEVKPVVGTGTGQKSNPAGVPATEKVSVDLSTPGGKPAADKPAGESSAGPLPFNEKVKVDLTK